jgi:predicted transcriptional regulator of viral defense system
LTQEKRALSMLNKNKGYLTAKEALANGIQNTTLRRMAEHGLIDCVARGLYVGADIIADPFYITQYRCPKGIFSHETALFFNNLSDRTPFQLMITIPSGWNTRLLSNEDLVFFYSSPKHVNLGTVKKETAYGHTVIVYDAERTLCDCLRNMDKLDKDLVLTALKRYMKTPGIDKSKLLEYAAVFKIRDVVMQYMEVLS